MGEQGFTNELKIEGNQALENIKGLRNITNTNGFFTIKINGNSALSSLEGLESLTTTAIIDEFFIEKNNSLTSLNGLQNFTDLISRLYIIDNRSLLSLDGLEGLTNFSGLLQILSNDVLENINALQNLTFIEGLDIRDNPALSDFCILFPLFESGNIGFFQPLSGNGDNPSRATIIENGVCQAEELPAIPLPYLILFGLGILGIFGYSIRFIA